MSMTTVRRRGALLAAASLLALTACTAGADEGPSGERATLSNCGQQRAFPAPAERIFVNDSNLVSMLLALGAGDQVVAVTGIEGDEEVLAEHYGDVVAALPQVSGDYPTLESVLAARPDVMVAGWSYGYDETRRLTPDTLRQRDIAAYVLTESCRQDGGEARGIVDPWTALRDDLTNLGVITGREDEAAGVVADIDERLDALREAPVPEEAPVLFLFDSGEKAAFTSGAFGAPQAIIEAAGGENATADVDDTWVEVSWEKLAAEAPDAFVLVDYPGQSIAQKIAVLRANPATRDLPAVREGRFLSLPYAMWTSSPLNIDAAERVRAALEDWGLVPRS